MYPFTELSERHCCSDLLMSNLIFCCFFFFFFKFRLESQSSMWKTHLLYFLSVWFCFMQNCYIYKSKTMNGKPLFDLFVKDLSGKWCRECSVSSFPPQLQKCPFCSESQSHPSWSLYLVYCLPCYQLQPTSSRPQQSVLGPPRLSDKSITIISAAYFSPPFGIQPLYWFSSSACCQYGCPCTCTSSKQRTSQPRAWCRQGQQPCFGSQAVS